MSTQTSTGTGTLAQRPIREWGRLVAAVASWPAWVWVVALTALAFILRRYNLGDESLWFDEADIVWRARQPLPVLLQGFVEAGENGPLYTLALHYWVALSDAFPPLGNLLHALFGASYEAPLRGLSALSGTAAIPAMYALAKRVGGTTLGLVAASLLALNPFHIWYSQDAKMYSLLVLMTIVTTLLYVEALQRNTVLLWAGYVVATWVMLTSHSMAALVLGAQLVSTPFLLREQRLRAECPKPDLEQSEGSAVQGPESEEDVKSEGGKPKSKIRWVWAMLLILTPLFPIAWLRAAALLTGTLDVGGWYTPANLFDIIVTTAVTFAVNRAGQPWEAIGAISMAALVLLYFRFRTLHSVRGQALDFRFGLRTQTETELPHRSLITRHSSLVTLLWLLPIFGFWLLTLKIEIFQPRYLIMSLPPYLILAASGLLALWRWRPPIAAILGGMLGVATLAALLGVNYSEEAQKEEWREAMVYVQDHLRLRDVIVVSPGYIDSAVNLYYKPGGPGQVPIRPVKAVPSLAVEGFGDPELKIALRDMIWCNERAWVVISPQRQKVEDPDNKVLTWFQENWLTFDKKVFNGVEVYGIAFNSQLGCWFPPPDYPEPHLFGNGIEFLGYIYELRDQSEAQVQSDASYFPLTMYWHADQAPTEDYTVRVRIKDPTGRVVVEDEAGPLNGYRPTAQWTPNLKLIDYRDIRLPGGLSPGDYTVTLQMYPKGQPEQLVQLANGGTEVIFAAPLKVVPWKP